MSRISLSEIGSPTFTFNNHILKSSGEVTSKSCHFDFFGLGTRVIKFLRSVPYVSALFPKPDPILGANAIKREIKTRLKEGTSPKDIEINNSAQKIYELLTKVAIIHPENKTQLMSAAFLIDDLVTEIENGEESGNNSLEEEAGSEDEGEVPSGATTPLLANPSSVEPNPVILGNDDDAILSDVADEADEAIDPANPREPTAVQGELGHVTVEHGIIRYPTLDVSVINNEAQESLLGQQVSYPVLEVSSESSEEEYPQVELTAVVVTHEELQYPEEFHVEDDVVEVEIEEPQAQRVADQSLLRSEVRQAEIEAEKNIAEQRKAKKSKAETKPSRAKKRGHDEAPVADDKKHKKAEIVTPAAAPAKKKAPAMKKTKH